MEPFELVPLEAGVPPPPKPRYSRYNSIGARTWHRAPLRLCRLLGFLILLPCLFIFIPLYLRYRVYSGQMYPMSMTDMRLIDSNISPTWCQRQVVKSNATFNAFVVPESPTLMDELVPVSMTRELELDDDMKEYWGFYLLKGSTVTVSTCVRYPGASLIMIKGYKHLKDCAYIGDDSSEELDELLEANKLGLLSNESLMQKIQELKKVDGRANDPEKMTRHKAGVSFHDPTHSVNVTSSDTVPNVDITDNDPKELREILEHLHALREEAKREKFKHYSPPSHFVQVPAFQGHREANVDVQEKKFLTITDVENSIAVSAEIEGSGNNNINKTISNDKNNKVQLNTNNIMEDITKTDNTLNSYLDKRKNITNDHINSESILDNKIIRSGNRRDFLSDTEKEETNRIKKEDIIVTNKEIADVRNETEKSTVTITSTSAQPTADEENSKEVFEAVLKRLQALGDRGKRVLIKLHNTMGVSHEDQSTTEKPNTINHTAIMDAVRGSDEELDHLRQILVEAIDEEKTRSQREQKRREAFAEARTKRELMLGAVELTKSFNEDDEARNYAAEEDLTPDGYAEHHEHVNETGNGIDMSNSELWSSFSSSEERLLECAGLILNLPLTPHAACVPRADAPQTDHAKHASANALTYRVPANGYYFFVFNSENEVQTNFIRARFDLQKTRYDVARTALRECKNSTSRCDLQLDIFSSQKVVLEVPLRNNDSLWNEHFVIISECEPRTSIYLVCVITVPILILVFAFQ